MGYALIRDEAWLEERVSKVQVIDGLTPCWEWTRARVRGYGQFGVRRAGKQKMVRAHRFSWELYNGPIPEDLCVLHRCDNPPCCNPEHLFLGTMLDNMRDMALKGRQNYVGQPKGEQHNKAKLTEKAVLDIRFRWKGGRTTEMLAKEYGVSGSTVRRIGRGVLWRHI
jgi:hypothetical protein